MQFSTRPNALKDIKITVQNHEQEINPYPRPEFLAEAGTGDYTDETADSTADGDSHVEGRRGAENRECYTVLTERKEMK